MDSTYVVPPVTLPKYSSTTIIQEVGVLRLPKAKETSQNSTI